MVVSMDKSNFSSAIQTGGIEIEIGNSSSGSENEHIAFGYGAGVIPGASENQAIFTDYADGPDDNSNLDIRALPDAIGIRVTYDPRLRMIRAYYDLDADQTDGEWTLFQSFTIDGSSVMGATSLNWGMTGGDAFFLGIAGSSSDEGSGNAPAIAAGSAWADDFQFNLGTTATSESGLKFADDFNDDSRTGDWGDPFVDSGSPSLIEENHRLELRASGSMNDEIVQTLSQSFWPRYDQAFEVRMEAHCLPAGLSAEGQSAILDLAVGNSSGNQDLLLSVAAIYMSGAVQQALVSDDSEVANDPMTDFPEKVQPGALPEVVGLRLVWNPVTKVMNCYVDTDGDRSKDTWTLFNSYSLDGSTDKGASHSSNWGMSGGDQFFVGVFGGSESVVVAAGEAYIDNFALINAPLLSGFELWASAIPDAGQRGASDDASGNGIPNLIQYMYGLTPLATDTDVKLSMVIEGGVPRLIHGFDESVTDYFFDYQDRAGLEGQSWSPGATTTMIETFQSNGKTFRKVTVPTDPANRFYRLEAIRQ